MNSNDHQTVARRLLGSAAFTRCRGVAARIEDDTHALASLLDDVATHRFGAGTLPHADGSDVDTACSVVRNRIEGLRSGRPPAPDARTRLVIAALLYLVTDDDVIPDRSAYGHLDDLAVLRWTTRVALDGAARV